MSDDILRVQCDSCGVNAEEPYIDCCECDANLCMNCFSNGREIKSHKNFHKYAIRRNDFPLFDNCNWSAKEECRLLSALSTYGYGNWEDIAKAVTTRNKLECHEHYKKYYIENVQYKELELLPHTEQSMYPKPIIPHLYSNEMSDNPPRNNHSDQHLAGYNAFRSEFELNYDHNSESILSLGDFTDAEEEEPLFCELKMSLARALNNRLQERRRRYHVIRRHGLIMTSKLLSWVQKFDKTLTRPKTNRLLTFMQFMSGMQFDALMESLNLEGELFQKLVRYREYRKNGIKSLYGVGVYERAKREHEIVKKEQKTITYLMVKKFNFEHSFKKIPSKKKGAPPLDIIDMPGFHLLSDQEAKLCSDIRLSPKYYLDIKEAIIAEYDVLGFISLSDARKISRIDVNKTRKIYDMMAELGFILKNPLDIRDLPGFHLLSEKENKLCSILRLHPQTYLTAREAIITEYENMGSVSLADARRVSRIDVNKTKKIYSMLVKDGLVVSKNTPLRELKREGHQEE